jgi:hypothetical protein
MDQKKQKIMGDNENSPDAKKIPQTVPRFWVTTKIPQMKKSWFRLRFLGGAGANRKKQQNES